MSLACSQCLAAVPVDPVTGRRPPWCPKCGTDAKAFTYQPTSVLDMLREARPAEAVRDADTRVATADRPKLDRSESPRAAGLADIPLEDLEAMSGPPRRMPQMGAGLLLVAVACLVGSAYWASSSFRMVTTYSRAEGTVTDLVVVRRSVKRAASVFPVVAYQVNGSRYQFESPYALSFNSYQRGDKVHVLYPPEKPGAGAINSFDALWAGPLLPGVPGLVLIVIWLCVHFGVGTPRVAPPRLYATAR